MQCVQIHGVGNLRIQTDTNKSMTIIKIGVDARHLSGHNNGIQIYLLNLLHYSIKNTQATHKWFLYCPYSLDKSLFNYENVKIINTPISTKFRGLHILFSQVFIPIFSLINKVDLMWFPANRSSILLPRSIAQVLSIHDLVWKKNPETMRYLGLKLDELFMTRSAKSADIITTVSHSSFDDIVRSGISLLEKIVVISNGVKRPSLIKKTKVKGDFCLFVGTVEPRKNLIRLLQAYSSLLPSIKDRAKLLIVGGKGWGEVNLRDMISQLNLSENVEFLGYVDDATLAKLYSNAQFLVMPSLYEGFGLPLVEAMSYGTPVLTANNSSMPEVSGNAGLLVDALDVKSIADGLQEMITNNQLRERLAKNAKLNAARYSWDESAKKLITVFEKAINLRKDKLS